jgi:hypothetical protein
VHCLREDAPAFTSGVALLHTSGEAAEPTTLGMVESEEKGERDMAREIPTLSQYNRKKKSTVLKKNKLRWFTVTVTDIWWCLGPGLYGRPKYHKICNM